MPKDSILSRVLLYDTLRDGTIQLLDWCVVDTTLGGMMEPRQLNMVVNGNVADRDPYDESFTVIRQMDVDTMFDLLQTGGPQQPANFNTN